MKYVAFTICMIFGSLATAQSDNSILLDVQTLSADSMEGRKVDTEGSLKAQTYLIRRFRELGLKAFNKDFRHSFHFDKKSVRGVNLIGCIPGPSKKAIVISAHYDHEGIKKGKIYNGADDNASGVACLLALAQYFQRNKPQHTLILVAFDAEETGLKGAKAFIDNPVVPKASIILNINMDMISHNDSNEIYAAGTYHHDFLKPYVKKVNNLSPVEVKMGHDRPHLGPHDWTFSSDHAHFHKAGIPFIYFGVEDHKDYHQPTDVYDNINKHFFLQVVRMIIDFTKIVDKELPG